MLETLDEQHVIGDLPGLKKRLETLVADSAEKKTKQREEALAKKTKLVEEAEHIAAHSKHFNRSMERLRHIVDEWKQIKGLERKQEEELWRRFAAAREALKTRRKAHFEELDRKREKARVEKEALIEKAEALKDSTDWRDTAAQYRELMRQWKAAGAAPRGYEEDLWQRFKAAKDHFYDARDAVNKERDAEFAANAETKTQLLDEYGPKIQPEKDLNAARNILRELLDKWDEIGPVPRARRNEFDHKIDEIRNRVDHAADEKWRQTDPEVEARAAQFQAKVDEFTKRAEQAEQAGNSKAAADFRDQAAKWAQWAETARKVVDGN